MWHVIYEGHDGQVQSRVARIRDLAIHMACELLQAGHVVRRAVGPNELTIEYDELEQHYDEGRFPGLRRGMLPDFLTDQSACHLDDSRIENW